MRALILFLFLVSLPVSAQHNNRSARDLQFRFGNPGARSLAFGGAFVALADDATAPVANPAGMVRTALRSASFEINYNRQDNDIPFQSGTVLQTNLFEFDYNLQTSSAPENTFQVPYLAAVFPKNNWRFGVFAHQQANLARNYSTDEIILCHFASDFYPNCENDPRPSSNPPSTDVLNLEMVNVGLSAAHTFGKLAVGVSVFYSDLDYQADSAIIRPTIAFGDVRIDRFARGDDADWGAIAGILWRLSPQLSVGATYKAQPEFTYTAQLLHEQPLPPDLVPPEFTQDGVFNIPDSISLGISVNPIDAVTLNLDINRVYYSQITDNLIDFTQPSEIEIFQSMPDITEIHLGVEWIFPNFTYPLSLRAGYWLEPYHAATNNVEDSQILETTDNNPENALFRDIFFLNRFAHDEQHFSLGMGLTLGQKFQLDFAVETADNSKNGTFSGIYRF